MGKVLPDVSVLGPLTSFDDGGVHALMTPHHDGGAPLNAHGVIIVYGGRLLQCETGLVWKCRGVQDLAASR